MIYIFLETLKIYNLNFLFLEDVDKIKFIVALRNGYHL
jgi:hypothetical protein